MDKIRLYLQESYNELLNKVTWPTWPNLMSSATVVLIASAIIALLVFAMDAVSNQVTQFFYSF
ncbi:MAG TPA: preprotein translocase subunit SecE [Saprospiraceae bacterium]|nr:preprotein translocase subunit SecE [Saprospiraceae bacterium]MCB9269782.1 preprotein translocase subunit SecE [Lewinellaceae bacterium]HPG06665.1 preprotein translocase subunit SecE [Saprospiraceae bacterium]HPR00352.1 preprotein translocase subunit SecE [Saprospiraceae bacterium]HQU51463.1 preprotein translocase subunit SecE [Saprospiraceae bacterium]